MKKSKVVRGIVIAVCILAALAVVVAGILFFPLTGEENTETWSADQEFDLSRIQTVEKTREDFKILMFTDTQLWTLLHDNAACYDEMDALVEKTDPDFIALPGDNLSAFASRFSIGNFIKYMDSYQVPWAPVYGNHDGEIPTTSLNWQGDQYMASDYCLFQKGPANLNGCGNYVINITEDGAPIYSIFMFDNGRSDQTYMNAEQIAWYEWNVNGIAEAAGRVIPSMAFSHIPLPQFRDAIEQYAVQNEDGSYTVPEEYGFGTCAYLPGASRVSPDFFEKCKELGSTKYLFHGHHHENNASITYEGITMTYGLKTGPSPDPWNSATEMGGTLITITGSGAEQNVNIEHIVTTRVSAE